MAAVKRRDQNLLQSLPLPLLGLLVKGANSKNGAGGRLLSQTTAVSLRSASGLFFEALRVIKAWTDFCYL